MEHLKFSIFCSNCTLFVNGSYQGLIYLFEQLIIHISLPYKDLIIKVVFDSYVIGFSQKRE